MQKRSHHKARPTTTAAVRSSEPKPPRTLSGGLQAARAALAKAEVQVNRLRGYLYGAGESFGPIEEPKTIEASFSDLADRLARLARQLAYANQRIGCGELSDSCGAERG
ncbi:MAG TPA: hypothetical protein VJ801_12265 [Polyangia bacterium]|jgi:hypothetical protein|nr:hypothetical protein [Polyangia bacterium]